MTMMRFLIPGPREAAVQHFGIHPVGIHVLDTFVGVPAPPRIAVSMAL
jgi:hypothetical protein